MAKRRKIPLRKCIVTKEMANKNDLIRVVRNKEGQVFVDETGKQNGRGAYLSKDLKVIETAEETNVLGAVFGREIEQDIYEQLKAIVSGQKNE